MPDTALMDLFDFIGSVKNDVTQGPSPMTAQGTPGGFQSPEALADLLGIQRGAGLAANMESIGARVAEFKKGGGLPALGPAPMAAPAASPRAPGVGALPTRAASPFAATRTGAPVVGAGGARPQGGVPRAPAPRAGGAKAALSRVSPFRSPVRAAPGGAQPGAKLDQPADPVDLLGVMKGMEELPGIGGGMETINTGAQTAIEGAGAGVEAAAGAVATGANALVGIIAAL